MKILMINKFLHPQGGSETYIFKLGKQLQARGHEVQYFGMDHENRIVGNRVNAYTGKMDFHGGAWWEKLTYGVRVLYSREARRKLRLVLEDFQPDVCHINNFTYQLTPSILLEIRKWRVETGKSCPIVHTAHDGQLVCPSHLLYREGLCTKCLGGQFQHCVKGKCIHNSLLRSLLGAAEGWLWNAVGVYQLLDTVIAPSGFLAQCLSANPVLKERTVVLTNFVDSPKGRPAAQEKPYVLYFGRYSQEKGVATLLQAVDRLPQIPFVFAGGGPLGPEIRKRKNSTDVGFLTGEALADRIAGAAFTVVPSEFAENCPFTVLESLHCGTPVLGARIGGIPELIRDGETGELFDSGSAAQLEQKIRMLWQDRERIAAYRAACSKLSFRDADQYCQMLETYYDGRKNRG